MSRPVTPIPGTAGSTTAASGPGHTTSGSRRSSFIGKDTTGIDHADQAPEYIPPHEAGHGEEPVLPRSNSHMSQSATYIPSRGGTLKKKASLHKTGSLKRSGSRKSSYAGSVRSMRLGEKEKYEPEEYNSAFYCPVPTTSSPTEILANRFQAWRRVLKDLITYFRDLHKSHETRSKALLSASNVINNITLPVDFLNSGGLGDAADILRDFHKHAIAEANKARDLENEVVLQLTGLRSDLSQKIKEIKSLSGDFKNSVHKEQEGTRKAVNALQDALGVIDQDAAAAAGKGDPFLIKMGVERQLERQIEEENYLHRAFLNLEASGRELESIVVGEIQKAYNVLAGILKRDADSNYDTAEKLREGPLAMARDHEWDAFTTNNINMVDPRQPLRQVKNITYEGKYHPAAVEVKSGMLERKSKYLKNYTPGWYILSPTHLHEFKSADQIPFQAPVMSLYLPEQKLGSHSEPGSSSHKFMIKGRQTGSMHRGHTWIFRAETHDTMMAWFSDIRELTEKRGEARNEFVRRTHARSMSGSSQRAPSIGSAESQMDEDEADKIAFSGEQSVRGLQLDSARDGSTYSAGGLAGSGLMGDDARSEAGWRPQRPQPGGRFPSDVNVTRGLQAPLSPSSGDSGDEHDREVIAAAGALPGSALPYVASTNTQSHVDQHNTKHEPSPAAVTSYRPVDTTKSTVPTATNHSTGEHPRSMATATGFGHSSNEQPHIDPSPAGTGYTAGEHPRVAANPTGAAEVAPDTQSQYHEWIGTAGAGLAGAGAGALGATAVHRHQNQSVAPERAEDEMSSTNPAIPSKGHSSAPIVAAAPIPQPTSTEGVEDTPRITASAYQSTTIPHPDLGSTGDDFSYKQQSAPTNGDLISGTDIRAPGGSALHYPIKEPESFVAGGVTSSTAPLTASNVDYSSPKAEPVFDKATPIRPSPVHTKSVQTISDLHIPGEFPHSATTLTRSG